MEPKLDIRHISVIDSLPIYNTKKEVLVIGCGDAKKDWHLKRMGYDVTSTDYFTTADECNFKERMEVGGVTGIEIHNSNLFDLTTFPKQQYENVICTEVLEHLVDWKIALQNLLTLTERRLIIGMPYKHSFNDPSPPPKGHANWWDDNSNGIYQDVKEFTALCMPYATSIQKIRTKPKDRPHQASYLIIIDKQQQWQ